MYWLTLDLGKTQQYILSTALNRNRGDKRNFFDLYWETVF